MDFFICSLQLIVLILFFIDSVSLDAAFPVGAARNILGLFLPGCSRRAAIIRITVVVFPVPGFPVKTVCREKVLRMSLSISL